MTVYLFDDARQGAVEKLMIEAREAAYVAENGKVWLTRVQCDACDIIFESTLDDVEAKLVSSVPLVCLACDHLADTSSEITRILVNVAFWV